MASGSRSGPRSFANDGGGRMTSIELRQLRYFVAVAEELHFGRAAQRLQIAQPGLSHQIKGLERLLGVPLFIRGQRGVELTDAGRALLEHARLLLQLSERAVESTRLAVLGKKGLLKVGTPAGGIHARGNELLRQFQSTRPDVQVEIHPGYGPQNVEELARHALDVAIVIVPFGRPETMRYLRLGSEELLLAIPEGHRLASLDRVPRAELLNEAFLDWPPGMNPTLIDHLHRSLFGNGQPARLYDIGHMDQLGMLLEVAESKGIAAALFPSVADLKIPRVVFRPMEDSPSVEYGIAWFDNNASPFTSSFIDLARELAGSPNAGHSVPHLA
jgi:DNA-binding transcriptional LysR family regulator